MVTIIDIAKRLNISKSTVSRALSDSPGVSEKTRVLVKQTAVDMNYYVNRMAQSLVDKQSRTIGFMIPDIADDFYSSMAIAAENVLERSGYTVSYMNMQRTTERARLFLQRAEENRWDGAFITLDDWNEQISKKLQNMNIPLISLRRKVPAPLSDRIPFVDSDRVEGVVRGIEYLISLHHENILFLSFDSLVGEEGSQAYKECMRKHGLQEFLSLNYFYQDTTLRIQQGYNSTKLFFEKYPQITAVFAGNDYLALGAMHYFREHGVSIPERVSILGYDNREVSALFCTQLSTIKHQIKIIGERAGELMLHMVHNKTNDERPLDISIPTTLYIRKTTGYCWKGD